MKIKVNKESAIASDLKRTGNDDTFCFLGDGIWKRSSLRSWVFGFRLLEHENESRDFPTAAGGGSERFPSSASKFSYSVIRSETDSGAAEDNHDAATKPASADVTVVAVNVGSSLA